MRRRRRWSPGPAGTPRGQPGRRTCRRPARGTGRATCPPACRMPCRRARGACPGTAGPGGRCVGAG
ncbi:hypothetical protein [Ornithinimicrobium kibberense]|uniref:hypothetical protein n=1 Tax=Ornithinimicrobium kibberense TaxID=282060 RepID=UPI00361F8040